MIGKKVLLLMYSPLSTKGYIVIQVPWLHLSVRNNLVEDDRK